MKAILRTSALFLVLSALAAFGDNNVNIIREEDQEKAVVPQRDTTIVMKPDTLSDSARNAERQSYTSDTVGAIRPSETKTLQRRHESKRFTAAGLGPAGFGNVDEDNPSYDFYVGRFWEVNPHAAIKALGEVTSDLDDNHMVDFNLGSNLYALPTEVSPYVGGQMGLSYGRGMGEPKDNDFGFNVGASIGALLLRTADAQMNLEGNAQVVLTDMETDDMPTVYSARLGVLF
jgi:hypothetical protein